MRSVDAQHVVASLQQAFTQVRAQEAGTAGDQHLFHGLCVRFMGARGLIHNATSRLASITRSV
jgi:hypothetical protein